VSKEWLQSGAHTSQSPAAKLYALLVFLLWGGIACSFVKQWRDRFLKHRSVSIRHVQRASPFSFFCAWGWGVLGWSYNYAASSLKTRWLCFYDQEVLSFLCVCFARAAHACGLYIKCIKYPEWLCYLGETVCQRENLCERYLVPSGV